jgi:hypothetical protein
MSLNVLLADSTRATARRDGYSGRRFRNLYPADEKQCARASRRFSKCPKVLYLCRGMESQNRAGRPSTLLSSQYETLFWLVKIVFVKW